MRLHGLCASILWVGFMTLACGGDDHGAGAGGAGGGGATGGAAGSSGTGGSGGSNSDGSAGTAGSAGSGFGGDTGCLGSVSWPAPEKPSYTFDAVMTDLQTKAPIEGAGVKLCPLADAACDAPLDTKTSDAQGKVSLTAPSSTQGIAAYLEITGSGVAPTLEFLRLRDNRALDGATVNVIVASQTTLSLFMTLLQVTPDTTRGSLTYAAKDCADAILAGLAASLDTADAKTITAYLAGGVPSKAATQTDDSGFGGFVNVPTPNSAPNATDQPGVFTTGTAMGPMDIVDSIVTASAAAAAASVYIREVDAKKECGCEIAKESKVEKEAIYAC